ncbi:MAG: hypothetical protein ACRDI0_07870 [Actinomycetota bacterium]
MSAEAPSRRVWARRAVSAGLIVLTVASVGGLFLWLVAADDLVAPPGFDTPKYLWRANLVTGQGLEALPGSSPYREHPDRLGYPVLAAFVRATTGISAFDLGFVLPAVMGVLVGLAAGTLAVRVLGEPRWAFPVYGFFVGASLNVVLTASGLIDNLSLDGVILAAGVGALLVSAGERAIALTLVLVAAGTLIHWPLTAVFVAILAALAVATVPSSVMGHRAGRPLGRSPAARLGMVVAGAAAVMAGSLALLSVPLQPPRTRLGSFLVKLARFVPRYHVPVVATAAALGIGALAVPAEPARRRGLGLVVIWSLVAATAVPLLVFLDLEVPAHRFLGFALGIPVLVAAAVTGAGRLLTRVPPRAVGAALATVAILGAAAVAVRMDRDSWTDRARVKFPTDGVVQAQAAGRHLSETGNRRPIVFVINPRAGAARVAQAATVAFGVIRSALPSDQIALAHVYLGDPADLLAGRPSLRDNRRYDLASMTHWAVVRPLLADDPAILLLAGFNHGLPELGRPEGDQLAYGVTVLRGPPVTALRPLPSAPSPPPVSTLVGRSVAVLAVLWLVGLGWSMALVPGGLLARGALAPVLGLSVLVIAGTLAGRLSLDAPGARPWIGVAVAVAGWAWPVARRWRRRS